MKTYFIILFLLVGYLTPALSHAFIYKSVDAQGNVTFTDKATPGSEKLTVEPIQTYSAPINLQNNATKPNDTEATQELAYHSVQINSPENQGTIHSNEGSLTVQVLVDPALKKGDKVRVLIDGAVVDELEGTTFQLTGIERGQHSLKAEVVNAKGTVLVSSPAVVFYLQKIGLNSPTMPKN